MPLPPTPDRRGGYCHPAGRWSVALYARGATNYVRCEMCPHPPPPARTRDLPVPTHVSHTFPDPSVAFTISPLHHLTTSPPHHLTTTPSPHLPTTAHPISPSYHFTISISHHLTISPSHHLPISPSPHLTTSLSHHLTISPSPHVTISPPHNLTTSPPHTTSQPHHLTRAAFPARRARSSRAPRPNSSTHPLCTGNRNGPLT